MNVVWTPGAVQALRDVARYIGRDDPAVARRFAAKLRRRADSLARFPKRGRVIPEYGRDDLRELIEGNYRIAYRIRGKSVEILSITEGHRLLGVLPSVE